MVRSSKPSGLLEKPTEMLTVKYDRTQKLIYVSLDPSITIPPLAHIHGYSFQLLTSVLRGRKPVPSRYFYNPVKICRVIYLHNNMSYLERGKSLSVLCTLPPPLKWVVDV